MPAMRSSDADTYAGYYKIAQGYVDQFLKGECVSGQPVFDLHLLKFLLLFVWWIRTGCLKPLKTGQSVCVCVCVCLQRPWNVEARA